jgi:hypothetical protein
MSIIYDKARGLEERDPLEVICYREGLKAGKAAANLSQGKLLERILLLQELSYAEIMRVERSVVSKRRSL